MLSIGDEVRLGDHRYFLTAVEHPRNIHHCNNCGELVKDWCLECEHCTNFLISRRRACNAANKLISLLQQDCSNITRCSKADFASLRMMGSTTRGCSQDQRNRMLWRLEQSDCQDSLLQGKLREREREREREMGLLHFSHEHSLIFEEEHKDDGVVISCFLCQQPISGPCYFCRECKHFFLHKVCADMPEDVKHPMHPKHPLKLLLNPPYSQSPRECGVCRQSFESFTYNCSLCKFDVDIMCALKVQKFEHRCHDHPLTPLQRPSLFLCDACGTRHEGTSYECSTCRFWVNQKCASLPSTIRYSDHKHLLNLIYCLPYEDFKFTSYCKICGQQMDRVYWSYYCGECKYFAHLNCLPSKEKLSRGGEVGDKDEQSSKTEQTNKRTDVRVEIIKADLSLPLADESTTLTTRFLKMIGIQGKSNKLAAIYHANHQHQLFLVDKQINDASCSKSKPIACDACAQPVSCPFYSCTECNFILHDFCAEIPFELEHPIHQHPLILNRWRSKYFDPPLCQGCTMSCNEIFYGCVHCDFFIDVKCASLIGMIKHESHQHCLALKEATVARCAACHTNICGVGLGCDTCNFNLHIRCALLPRTFTHRYDKHPFPLVYYGSEDEYYCEFCLEEINPNCWLYDCAECRQSLHTKCICPAGSLPRCIIKHDAHVHTIALKETNRVPCVACKYEIHGFGFVCEENCNFTLHIQCASMPQTLRHRCDEHVFLLRYSGNEVECSCEICKMEIDKNDWFYQCGDCNQYLHPTCVRAEESPVFGIGVNISGGIHQHHFIVTRHPEDVFPCDNCGDLVEGCGLKCAHCGFLLHTACAAHETFCLLKQRGKYIPLHMIQEGEIP